MKRKNFLDFETLIEEEVNIDKNLDYIYSEISKLKPNKKIDDL